MDQKMKKSIIEISILALIVCTIGCSKKETPLLSKISKESIMFYKNNCSYEQVFKYVETINLEASDSALIASVWGIGISNDNNIVIQESGAINAMKMFSSTGRFIRKIGRIGQGPGEYGQVSALRISNNKIILLDLALQRVSIYSKEGNYEKSWKISRYYSDIAVDDNKIVLLRHLYTPNDNDFDVFDYDGNLLFSDKFSESKNKEIRQLLAGNAFHISIFSGNLYYIGNDDYKLICYDLIRKEVLWEKQNISGKVKRPEKSTLLNIDPVKNGLPYTAIWELYTTEKGLILVETQEYFLIYDDLGNYLNTVNKKYSGPGYVNYIKNNSLYSLIQEYPNQKNDFKNPLIEKYDINEK